MFEITARMIKKLVSSLTASCFLFSFVCAPAIEAAAFAGTPRGISPAVGRITGSKDFGGPTLVVTIQDLHLHPGVQHNIASIIRQLDKDHALQNVYVEGGYGDVDTSWLSAVADASARDRIREDLLKRGALTGAEYYSMASGRYDLLKGLEDERTHKRNIVRLGDMLKEKPRFERALREMRRDLSFMQAKYFSEDNKRLDRAAERYRAGKLSSEQYYRLLVRFIRKINEDPGKYNLRFALGTEDYPNILLFCTLAGIKDGLRYAKANRQLPQFLHLIKDSLSYDAFAALMQETGNFRRMDALVAALERGGDRSLLDQAAGFPELARVIEYVRLNGSLDPVELVREENRLLERLRAALSRDAAEADVSFLTDFYRCFEDYLLNRLSAEDYAYFKDRFAKFKTAWERYVFRNRVLDLAGYFPRLDEYYAENDRRNDVFLSKLTAGHAGLAPGVYVIVAGGFHTEGITRILEERKISYVTITPNVTRGIRSSSLAYGSAARKLAKKYSSEALALTLPSSGAEVIEATDTLIRLRLAGSDTYTYRKIAGRWVPDGAEEDIAEAGTPAEVTSAVNEAARMAAEVLPRRIGYTAGLVKALVEAAGERGSPELWGGNGLIWNIVSETGRNEDLENALGGDINAISQLPDVLQNEKLYNARKELDAKELAAENSALAPLFEIPGMYAFWKIALQARKADEDALREKLKDDAQKTAGITFTKGGVSREEFLAMMAAIPNDYDVKVVTGDGAVLDAREISAEDLARTAVSLTSQAVYHRYKNTAYKYNADSISKAGLKAREPLTENDDPSAYIRENFLPSMTAEEMRNFFEETPSAAWEAGIRRYIAEHLPFIESIADTAVTGEVGADNPKLIEAYRKIAAFYYSAMAFKTPFVALCVVRKPGARPNYDILRSILDETRGRTSIDQTDTVYDYLYDKMKEDLNRPFAHSPKEDRAGFEEELKALLNGLNGQNALKYLLISATFPLHATGPRLVFARSKLNQERYRRWNEILTAKAFDPADVAGRNKRALPIVLLINGMHCSNTFEVDADVEYALSAPQKRRILKIIDENLPRPPQDGNAPPAGHAKKAAPRPGAEKSGRVILDTVVFSGFGAAVGRFGAAAVDADGNAHVFVKFVRANPEQGRGFGIRPDDLKNLGFADMFAHTRTGSFLVFVPEGRSIDEAAALFRANISSLKRVRAVLDDLKRDAGMEIEPRELVPGIHIVEGSGETRYDNGWMTVPMDRFGDGLSGEDIAAALGELMRERRERERTMEEARYFRVLAATPDELVQKLSCFRGATEGNIVIPGAVFDGMDEGMVRKVGEFFRGRSIDIFVDLGKGEGPRELYFTKYLLQGFAGFAHADETGAVEIVRYNAEKSYFYTAVKPDVLELNGDSANCDEIAGRLLNDTAPLLVDLTNWASGNRPRDISQAAAISSLVIDMLQKDALEKSLKEHLEGFKPEDLKAILASA